MRRKLFWTLFGVTAITYGVMVGWSLPIVSHAAGGLAPFDMRPFGYDFAEAQAFLSALSPEGAIFYMQVQHSIDTFYPALIAATLYFALVALSPHEMRVWRHILATPALAIAFFDWAENYTVGRMLEAGTGHLTPELVSWASHWTVLKSGFTAVVEIAIGMLLLWHGLGALSRWRSGRGFRHLRRR